MFFLLLYIKWEIKNKKKSHNIVLCYPLDVNCMQIQRGSSCMQINWVFSSTMWQCARHWWSLLSLGSTVTALLVRLPLLALALLRGRASFRGSGVRISITSRLVLCSLLISKGMFEWFCLSCLREKRNRAFMETSICCLNEFHDKCMWLRPVLTLPSSFGAE